MVDSDWKQIQYMKEQVGDQAKVELCGMKSVRHWVVKCRFCSVPNPAGGEPQKIRVEGLTKREVLAKWREHESLQSHQIDRDWSLQ